MGPLNEKRVAESRPEIKDDTKPMTTVKSPLRYPGGKSRAIRQILKDLPPCIEEYREPFLGGGSVFLAMKCLYDRKIRRYVINDLNEDLIYFWRAAQQNINELVHGVKVFKDGFNNGRELWRHLHAPDTMRNELERAVRFFVLNRITFSGMVDSGGYSRGSYEGRFTDSSIVRLQRLEPLLRDVEICHGDYEPLLHCEGDNVFIFLDPPYWKATQSRLYGVNGELHTSFDHERFAENMRRCSHKWLITYDDSPVIRDLFSFADIKEWTLQYGMNNYMQGKAEKGNELFIRNY